MYYIKCDKCSKIGEQKFDYTNQEIPDGWYHLTHINHKNKKLDNYHNCGYGQENCDVITYHACSRDCYDKLVNSIISKIETMNTQALINIRIDTYEYEK